jgi:hypothetical protein
MRLASSAPGVFGLHSENSCGFSIYMLEGFILIKGMVSFDSFRYNSEALTYGSLLTSSWVVGRSTDLSAIQPVIILYN